MERAPTLLPAALVLGITGGLVATKILPFPSQAAPTVVAADEHTGHGAIAFTLPLPECEGWPDDFDLYSARGQCWLRADLEIGARWEFRARAEVVDGRVVKLTFGAIEHNCSWCYDHNAEGREARDSETHDELFTCVRQHILPLRFPAQRVPRCVFETSWALMWDR
jgi:hypothetical protein